MKGHFLFHGDIIELKKLLKLQITRQISTKLGKLDIYSSHPFPREEKVKINYKLLTEPVDQFKLSLDEFEANIKGNTYFQGKTMDMLSILNSSK